MTGEPDGKERWAWWRAHELSINLAAMAVCLILLFIGLVLGIGVLAGLSVLLLIFFGTYTIYAYIRRYW